MNTEQADAERLKIVVKQLRKDRGTGNLTGLRVLDLACRVGAFSVGLGRMGVTVHGVEGRQSNLDEAPTLDGVTYECADVRTVSPDTQGVFDATLCLGLLYHLDAESAFELLRTLGTMTRGLIILDTHVDRDGNDTAVVASNMYFGHFYQDFDTPWGSIGNSQSFWFTPNSLHALLEAAELRDIVQVTEPNFANGEGRAWFTAKGTAT